ncbi:unnamed protein product [Moneuplotes crassus]|uniref:Uncharacterized protein n=1 Tax=Euplotes crassus TaxID=5936 RepID=A0AAD2D9B5_EUPCR|nr:unnamed protein product [Moneuplotes crassus]
MDEIVEIYEHSGEEKCEKLIYEIFWMMRVTIYRIQRSSLNFELIEYLCKATLACSSPKVLSCILSIFLYIIKQFVAEIKSENGNTEARDSFQRARGEIYPVLFECIPIIKVSEDNLKFMIKILELTLFPEDQLDQQAVDLYEETGLREFVQEVEDHKFQGLRDKASDLEFRIQKGQRMEEDLKCDGEALYFG